MLKLSSLYSDGMIIQRNAVFPLAGFCAPNDAVEVVLRSKTYKTLSDDKGAWRILIDADDAGGPYDARIKSFDEEITIHDIYFGEVWFCGGQSNMELMMERVKDNFIEEWDKKDFPLVREFRVPQSADFKNKREIIEGGNWKTLNSETLNTFSAVSYFFALRYAQKHDVPIGLLNASWGGSPAEAWTSREAVEKIFPYKIEKALRYADCDYRKKVLAENQKALSAWSETLYKNDAGLSGHWENGNETEGWKKIELPVYFKNVPELKDFCGVIYLKKKFTAAKQFAENTLKLWLGTIVDADKAYINGTFIGTTLYRYPPRKYNVPRHIVREGENEIILRIVVNNGLGEITPEKQFKLFIQSSDEKSVDEKIELYGTWEYKIGFKYSPRPEEIFLNREAFGLYNAMIYPVRGYPVKGVLFYQAESNDKNPFEYEKLFQALINDWRETREELSLPFIFAQLPRWGAPGTDNENDSWAVLRGAQQKALAMTNTAMAVTLDAGEWNDLHPMDKKTVGERLFLAAEKLVFKDGNSSPGPLPLGNKLIDNELTIIFDNCAEGLKTKGKITLTLINEKQRVEKDAFINGKDSIGVKLDGFAPSGVLYAWANAPRGAGLFNSEGLPAAPFNLTFPRI